MELSASSLSNSEHARITREAQETIRSLEELFRNGPDSINFFLDLQRSKFTSPGLQGSAPLIGMFCIQVPEEIIRALGANLVRLCSGSHALALSGAELLPARSCSIAKASVGMLRHLRNIEGKIPQIIIIPTTCDQKRKSYDLLREEGFPVYPLEVPPGKNSEEARRYWRNSVKNLVPELEKITGVRLTRKRLSNAITQANSARSEYRTMLGMLESAPAPMYGTASLLVSSSYHCTETFEWTLALGRLNHELNRRKRNGTTIRRDAPRILLTGSPIVFPNLKVPLLIERSGAVVVVDELCTSSRLLWDPCVYSEEGLYEMIPAIADRCLKPCTCPFFVSNDDSRRRIIEMAKRFGADGIVYQTSSGCTPFEIEFRLLAEAVRKERLPVLYLETDYSPEDLGQLSTRVEAFIESIGSR